MSSSETGRNDSQEGTEDTPLAADTEAGSGAGQTENGQSGRRYPSSSGISATERDGLLRDVRAIQFPTSLRGYDRAAVDRYVEGVTRIIAELEMTASPEAAVRHALDEVSEETRDILQQAHETAEEITERSRAQADDQLRRADLEAQAKLDAAQQEGKKTFESAQRAAHDLWDKTTSEAQTLEQTAQREAAELKETTMREVSDLRETAARETEQLRARAQREADELLGRARHEAAETVANADARARELAHNAEAIWRERRRLIDDVRAIGEQLTALGEVEGKRFSAFADELLSGDGHAPDQRLAATDGPVPEGAT